MCGFYEPAFRKQMKTIIKRKPIPSVAYCPYHFQIFIPVPRSCEARIHKMKHMHGMKYALRKRSRGSWPKSIAAGMHIQYNIEWLDRLVHECRYRWALA